jgi:exodeoxyribonuclease III
VRLATWNVNSVTARLPRLLDWLAGTAPDVVCLQETKTATFPVDEVERLGYTVAAHGDGRWNGVAVLSRVGLDEVTAGFPGEPGNSAGGAAPRVPPGKDREPAQPALLSGSPGQSPGVETRALGATCAGVRVWSVYVPNGRVVDSPHYGYKLAWLAALRDALAVEVAGHAKLAVCGDFNVAPADSDVWDPAAFVGSTHVTGPERRALAELRDLGLHDVVPRPLKGRNPFTYWDYRAGMFHKDMGMRIDLVYATAALAESVTDAYIDREARKGKGPSDHAPIVIDC